MSTQTPAATVQVGVTINARIETVWSFLSERDRFLSWMTFIPGAPIPPGSTFEPRVGGALRIVFPNGGEAKGSVLEIDPPRRLVFTWGYEPDIAKTGLGPGACRVELQLVEIGAGTRVTLTHSGPMSPELAKGHEQGWRHYLALLASQGAAAQHTPGLGAMLADYFAAWNEPDDAARRTLLAKLCEPGVRVRTQFACTDSIDELCAHIGNGLRHMPGMQLALNGEPRHLHGFVRIPWAVKGPQGIAFAGENFVSLTPHGRIASVVGFANVAATG